MVAATMPCKLLSKGVWNITPMCNVGIIMPNTAKMGTPVEATDAVAVIVTNEHQNKKKFLLHKYARTFFHHRHAVAA